MTQRDVEQLVREVDTSGKGMISFEQFRKLFADSSSAQS
jgi:Ca2+-binding EF-hand superfamily protein